MYTRHPNLPTCPLQWWMDSMIRGTWKVIGRVSLQLPFYWCQHFPTGNQHNKNLWLSGHLSKGDWCLVQIYKLLPWKFATFPKPNDLSLILHDNFRCLFHTGLVGEFSSISWDILLFFVHGGFWVQLSLQQFPGPVQIGIMYTFRETFVGPIVILLLLG